MTLETKQKKVLKYKLLGMLEALELASKKMKDPHDIMLIDLDDNGAIKFMTKKQMDRLEKDQWKEQEKKKKRK